MKETTKVMSTEELVDYMDEWFEKSKSSYTEDEHTEVHVNHIMGDVLNLMKVVRALAKGLNNLENRSRR